MFKNGDLIDIHCGGLSEYNPWTILDEERHLLGSKLFNGHYGDNTTKGTAWDGHCWYYWDKDITLAVLTLENE